MAGLKPFTEYEVRVAAVNLQGEGNMSRALYVHTQEAGWYELGLNAIKSRLGVGDRTGLCQAMMRHLL